MTVLELCNPIYLLVIGLRRRIAEGNPPEYEEIRHQAIGLLNQAERWASEHGLTDRWIKARTVMIYLIDEVAISETWSGKQQWNEQCLEIEQLGHTQRMRGEWFYTKEVDGALAANDVEMMEILYYALCLGFRGMHHRNVAQLQQVIDNLYARLPKATQSAEEKLFQKAYEVDKTRNDPRAPLRILTVLAVFFGVMLTYFVVNQMIYRDFVRNISEAAKTVMIPPTAEEPKESEAPDEAEE
jgi:type IV/VI secretion system ImpK/VasF family protein